LKRIHNLIPLGLEERKFLENQYCTELKEPSFIALQTRVSEALIWKRLAFHGLRRATTRQKKLLKAKYSRYCDTCKQAVNYRG
jgi:hypothetical protein